MPNLPCPPPPPFCPNAKCEYHLNPKGWSYKRTGYFECLRAPLRVQRFQCSSCRRNFSTQTFTATYWLRRPDLLEAVFRLEVSCAGHRQIARALGVAHATVQHHAERLGRHCLLFHERSHPRARKLAASEDNVLDGLGSFAGGQYWPFELNNLIGARSYYSHDFTLTERRRAGRQTPDQKRRRAAYEEQLGRPAPGAHRKDIQDLLETSLPPGVSLTLRSDEHKTYPWALRRLKEHRIQHETTHSKQPRTPSNPLFPINAHHLLIRHSGANHKRETVAFSKRNQAAIYRQATFQVWRNCVKSASERRPGKTPAQRLGVLDRRLEFNDILRRRIFSSRMKLTERLSAYYGGEVRSRFCRGERKYFRRYAY
jgi:transposase-like protein